MSRRFLAALSHRLSVNCIMADLQGAICGLGNPLLDISAHVDPAFLDKYQVLFSFARTIAA